MQALARTPLLKSGLCLNTNGLVSHVLGDVVGNLVAQPRDVGVGGKSCEVQRIEKVPMKLCL